MLRVVKSESGAVVRGIELELTASEVVNRDKTLFLSAKQDQHVHPFPSSHIQAFVAFRGERKVELKLSEPVEGRGRVVSEVGHFESEDRVEEVKLLVGVGVPFSHKSKTGYIGLVSEFKLGSPYNWLSAVEVVERERSSGVDKTTRGSQGGSLEVVSDGEVERLKQVDGEVAWKKLDWFNLVASVVEGLVGVGGVGGGARNPEEW